MKGKYKKILIYCILILLAAALVTYGAFINTKKVSSPEDDYDQKLAELEADLREAAKTGPEKKSSSTNRTSTCKRRKIRRK